MRVIGSRMYVGIERPAESKTKSGLYIPPAGVNTEAGIAEERAENEWWPTQGVVIAGPPRFKYGHRGTGEYTWSRHSQSHIEVMADAFHPWKVPSAGETAYFGHMDLNPKEPDLMWDGTGIWVEPSRCHCVRGTDGKLRANGQWCIVERIPEDVADGPIITSISVKDRLGMGIVRMVGDGFAQKQPEVSVGSVVRFKVFNANPVIPNPDGGDDLTRILAEWVIGIDLNGISEEDFQQRKAKAEELRITVSQALATVAAIKVEDDIERKKRIKQERGEWEWKQAEKSRRKETITRRAF